MNPLASVGRAAFAVARETGSVTLFGLRGVRAALTPPVFWGQLARQLFAIGWLSLPVVGLTAAFTGAALALNIHAGGGRLNAEQILPQIVVLGITRELGPVLAALMLAGRVSAAIAAEIGAMRTTQQIDALQTLSTDPLRYLVAPRLLAAVIAAPLLTLVADILGVAGAWLVATATLDFSSAVYLRNSWAFLEPWDVISGLLKAVVFGLIVGLMGCWHGYRASAGARGVGRAATQAVVSSAVLILFADYLLTSLFT